MCKVYIPLKYHQLNLVQKIPPTASSGPFETILVVVVGVGKGQQVILRLHQSSSKLFQFVVGGVGKQVILRLTQSS